MITQFRSLFTLAIAHAYYRGACRDFDFLVPAETARWLQNGKLLAKVRDGQLHVLFEANEANAPVANLAGQTLRFGLKLLQPYFSNVTALPFDPGATKALYRNTVSARALDAVAPVGMVGSRFRHALTQPARPVTVTLKNATGQTLATETVTADHDRESVAFELSGHPAGLLMAEASYPAATDSATYYHGPELLAAGVFGVVEITVRPGFYTTAPAFTVPFSAREQTLKYYVLAKHYSEAEFNQLTVTDAGFTEEGRPRVEFSQVPVADFTAGELPPALVNPGADRLVLFKSQTAVSRQEAARKRIQLNKNGEVLIPHLPQPAADQTSADLIVHIAKPQP